MFERFTERARQVVICAQTEARLLKHSYIGTEHILLGLLAEEKGLGARVLGELGVGIEDARNRIRGIVGEGDEVKTGQLPFTPRGKRSLELSLREALSFGNNYIGTEHILLGLVRENEGVAARVLLDLEVTPQAIRDSIIKAMSGSPKKIKPTYEDALTQMRLAIVELQRLAQTLEELAEDTK